jgi:hypothetical protein
MDSKKQKTNSFKLGSSRQSMGINKTMAQIHALMVSAEPDGRRDGRIANFTRWHEYELTRFDGLGMFTKNKAERSGSFTAEKILMNSGKK